MTGSSRSITGTVLCTLLISTLIAAQSSQSGSATLSSVEVAKWREDLRHLAQEMPKHHGNLFHAMTREEFDGAIKRLDERIPGLGRHQVIVEMARIVAGVKDGHTSLSLVPPHGGAPFKVGFREYPLRFYLYPDGLFVQSATSDHGGIVGARVVKIGETSSEEAFKAVSEIVSRDNEMTLKDRVPELLRVPEVLHALGLIRNMEKATFTIESKGAQTILELSPMTASHDIKWVDARDPVTTSPLWLKDPHNNYWFDYMADSRTVYFQYNAVVNKFEGESLNSFSKKLFAFIEGHAIDRLIIDMRMNSGGNGVLSWPLIYGIIRSDKINQKGKLFTIIGRHTFSAGSMTAAWFGKHTNTTFVGEPTGGGINVFGDHVSIVMPNSGIAVMVAPHYFQNTYPWDKRPWIAPQIAAELSLEDYKRNNDPALKAILAYKPIVEVLTSGLSQGGVDLMLKKYREFKNDPATRSINTEADLNALGYELLQTNRFDEALAVFKLNVESYAQSANAFDSLGDAYMKRGDKELAIKSYKRALELNPHSDFTRQKLDGIQKP